MKFFLLLTALAQAVLAGNLLSPADVTYVDGAYHAGLAAGPIVASNPQPVPYAAVPTVQHVPAVADVPVTRIDAQPALLQKTVDLARPAVKTQRYEVRRPAIQKQFYDIEERVVVRPAGSAVVELEEPLSSTQKGPSVIRPAGEPVPIAASAVAVPAAPVGGPEPPELPSVEINLARSSLPAPPALPSPGITRTTFAAAAAPAPSVGVRTTLTASAPVAVPLSPVPSPARVQVRPSYSAASLAYPAAPILTQPAGISPLPIKTVSVSAVPATPSPVSFPTPAPQYQQQQIIQTTPAPQFSDDSVSIDSADFRSGSYSGRGAVFRAASPRASLLVNYPNALDLVPQARFGAGAVQSGGELQSEINHENQQKLIQLLTARGNR